MNEKKHIFILSILLIVLIFLGVANLYVFKHRDNGFLYHYVNYNSLYVPNDVPAITGFDFTKKHHIMLIIKPVEGRDTSWTILVDKGKSPYVVKGRYPSIRLLNGKHLYQISSDKEKISFSMEIGFTGSKKYAASGYVFSDNCQIINSTIPIVNFKRFPVNYLCYDKSIYPAKDIAEGEKILEDEIGIKKSDSTEAKIFKISSFILKKFKDKPGIPDDKMQSMTPLEQYYFVNAGKSGIWCSNYAMIYTFFAICADIPTRLVALKGKLDDVQLTGHIFSESFISEQSRWAKVDVISNIFLIKNRDGKVLNTADILHMVVSNTPGRCIMFKADDNDKIVQEPYSGTFALEKESFNRNVNCVYYFPYLYHHALFSKISHYMLKPDLAYSLSASNIGHYIKLSLFYGTLLVGLLFICLLFKMLLKRVRKMVDG